MEERLSVLIVEDDVGECNALIAAFDRAGDAFSVAGVTNDSRRALQLTVQEAPNAVILDLELHAGGGDGIEYLRQLRETDLPFKPFILVTTNNVSRVIHDTARAYGADYIFTKSQSGYSEQSVIDFLTAVKPSIMERKTINGSTPLASPAQREKRLKRIICDELDAVGISSKALGYKYLVQGILNVLDGNAEHICEEIAMKYGKSPDSVERAIQGAINRAWSTGDAQELYKIYTAKIRSDRGVPTLTEFIFYYARKIDNTF